MDKTTFLFVYTALLKVVNSFFTDLFLSPRYLTWSDSKQYCEGNGGRLLVVDSQEKWDYFTAHQDYTALGLSHGNFWIGMKFDGSVRCDTSHNWVYQGWGHWANDAAEPNHCPSERCIKIKHDWMRTEDCLHTRTALCQKDSTTVLSTTVSTTDITITSFEPTTTYVVSETAATSSGTERTDSMSTVQTTGSDRTFSVQMTQLVMQTGVDFSTTQTIISTQSVVSSSTTSTLGGSCGRMCCIPINQTQLSHEELEQMQQALKDELLVNKTSLSSHRRRLVSVYDSRPSSVAMGGVACAIMAIVLGVIAILDCKTLCAYMLTN